LQNFQNSRTVLQLKLFSYPKHLRAVKLGTFEMKLQHSRSTIIGFK